MGIPSYFSYIVKNHIAIIKKYVPSVIPVHNLYMDCNSIIYDVIHSMVDKNSTNKMIISAVIEKIEKYVQTIEPSKLVFIAFDGVAPVAKLEQQRIRRYKSHFQNEMTKKVFGRTEDSWNTAAITPGTEFMKELNAGIIEYYSSNSACSRSRGQVGDRRNSACSRFGGDIGGEVGSKVEGEIGGRLEGKVGGGRVENCRSCSYIISTSADVGEGEHKLFHHIRANPLAMSETSVVYGLDADLIMLAINHLPISPQIYLFRETPEFIKSIDKSLEPGESYLMDIPLLAETINQSMSETYVPGNLENSRVYDYIFLCFFLGNDFMPHFPALNIRTGGIDKLLNAYKATIGLKNGSVLTDGSKIYWKNVRILVQHLASLEEDYIKNEMKGRDKREKYAANAPEETPEQRYQKFESIPTYERQTEKYINPFKEGWQSRYYTSLFKLEINDERRKQIALNYMQGLEWTMKYYTSGCPDWRWHYQHNYPPLLQDLVKFIPVFDTEFVPSLTDLANRPVQELVQLMYVLPRQSLHLLPKDLFEKMDMSNYPTDCDFVWAYCRYFWESHVELPELDLEELNNICK
jgi:5'-3' exonuclease